MTKNATVGNKPLSLKDVNLSNKRGIQEEYLEYRERLQENYYKVKYYIKGQLWWDSLAQGTYITRKKWGQ